MFTLFPLNIKNYLNDDPIIIYSIRWIVVLVTYRYAEQTAVGHNKNGNEAFKKNVLRNIINETTKVSSVGSRGQVKWLGNF